MEKKIFPKIFFLASEVVKIEKSSYFVQKTPKTWFCTKKVKKNWGEHVMSVKNTFIQHDSLVYAQKSCLYWSILWVIWCILLYFSPKWAFCQNLTPLRFRIPVETLKLNKMAVFAWINLKIKICELYYTTKKNSKHNFWGAREV